MFIVALLFRFLCITHMLHAYHIRSQYSCCNYSVFTIFRYNLYKRVQTVMRNQALSAGKRFRQIFLPKSLPVLNKPRKPAIPAVPAPAVVPAARAPVPAPVVPAPCENNLSPYDPDNFSQDPLSLSMDMEYDSINDDALMQLDMDAAVAAPVSNCINASSFPSSPPPTLQSTPSLSPLQYTPAPRDYALDYEACLVCVEDLGRLVRSGLGVRARSARAGEVRLGQYSEEDVLPLLREMKDMLDRFFNRPSSGPDRNNG